MEQSYVETIEGYVVFTTTDLKYWIFKYLDPYFQHCYFMKKSKGEQFWLIINPRVSHISTNMLPIDMYPDPRSYAGEDAVIIPIKTTIKLGEVKPMFCVFNCVEVVKGLLGIKKFWIHTPRQLYKYLIREN